QVCLDPEDRGLMRRIMSETLLAGTDEVCRFPEKVQINDRAKLIRLAQESGKRGTIFLGLDEHMTFVLDPDPGALLEVHLYDISPPRPVLSATIRELEGSGLFGELNIRFVHHVTDISALASDVYPCRAAGFSRTLDADPVSTGDRVAGCRTGRELVREVYGAGTEFLETCPLAGLAAEPFIARCCRAERAGTGIYSGYFGTVVHWGASPAEIFDAVRELIGEWRRRGADSGR
ncbi:MAG: hypothetical protein LUO88_00195, partial [Methanoregulaceae archaeon]|nr:hypothetical protein [Methanoregulaceae archaeon]